jgi:hypothetical protein
VSFGRLRTCAVDDPMRRRMTLETQITLQYLDGCPNWQLARKRLTQALERWGDGGEIKFERVETAEDADRLGCRGSPTILIEGSYSFAAEGAAPSLSCRVYATEAGWRDRPP